ncbi:hypothetical protein RHGRI_018301 [Rhododendron griersonianum]|uniref:Uncharacterized protein n=1 Tax=Rhododendron griersonianum TaxID=479676 RepID=A0AAV6HIL1_9ERIC|nr:hypothetical protein RHGRI_038808 [Rhododendron griersonianum]KAG5546077.1 hypothetical protein RHGRI_018301 [Rhododendron griersonianum]
MHPKSQDWLASTCPTFVGNITVRKNTRTERRGSDYYLQTDDGRLVLVASSFPRTSKRLRYVVNREFIIRYSSMFNLGTIFEWDACDQFKHWMESLVNCTPQYIQPHLRAINQLGSPDKHPVHHSCWFLAPINLQYSEMKVQIPSLFQQYMFAPRQAIVMIKSGQRSYHAKIEDFVITIGWENIILDHTFGKGYTALFGLIGHLMLDMFIFDCKGNSIQYNWSTTEPVKHLNAPSTWDSNQMFTKVTGANLVTACTPHLFRQIGTEYRFCRKITPANWAAMELCATLQELAYGEGLNQFTVKTKEQAWYISYADGCLRGLGWESFVIAHTLREDDTLLFSMDVDLNLIAMVFDQEGCERTFYWYTNTDDDATSFNQETQ